MEDTVIVHLLSNIGVPAALCFYTLFNVNENLKKLTEAFNRWNELFDRRLTDIEKDVNDIKRRAQA